MLLSAVPLRTEAHDDPVVPLVAPNVQSTVPGHGETNVSLAGFIEVGFSEDVNRTTFLRAIVPSLTVTETWPRNDIVRLTPVAGFSGCTAYDVQVAVRDLDENLPLSTGLVPNPWRFITACDRPFIIATAPAHLDTNVPEGTNIVIDFSEPMQTTGTTGRLSLILNPSPQGQVHTWSRNNTRVTSTTTLSAGVTYTATANGTDLDGNFLVEGLVSNPWSFSLNAPPVVSSPSLSALGCLDAGTPLTISWTMADDSSPTLNLTVTLSYRDANGTQTIAGPVAGFSSPASYPWVLPAVDVSTNVMIEVSDSAGGVSKNWSKTFRIDTGAPRVLSTIPENGAIDVPYQTTVTIGFSEAMNQTTVAILEDPAIGGSPMWVSGGTRLQIGDGMIDRQTYVITIRGSARDTCGAGHPMGADYTLSFTTGNAPPAAPGGLVWVDRQETSVTLRWDPVTEFETGRPIPTGTTVSYLVFRNGAPIGSTNATRFVDARLRPSTTYTYTIQAFANLLPSEDSAPLTVRTQAPFFTTLAGQFVLLLLAAMTVVGVVGWGQIRQYRHRTSAGAKLQEEVRELVALIKKARTEPNPSTRRTYEEQLQSRFLGLVAKPGPSGEVLDPRLELLYRALAQALVQSPEVDVARGRSLVDARLGLLAPGLAAQGAAYRLLSEAEASVSSDLFRGLPESGRKALLLVYFYSLEEYLSNRLRVMVPPGSTVLLGDRGHINVRRRGWEQQWAGLSLGNLLYLLDHNRHMFLADVERWEEDVEPFVHQTVDARNRTAHPSREAPPLDRVRELIYTSFRLLESVLKAPKGAAG